MRHVRNTPRGRSLLAAGVAAAILGAPFAVAAGEGENVRIGQRNPSGGRESAAETELIARNGTYGTRQSNLTEGDGGGAIYGCRSAPGNEPCVRANNLKDGLAFEFESGGSLGGTITVRGANARPFTTNATAVATGLNADQVDGKEAADFMAADRIRTIPMTKLAAGERKELAKIGPFTLTAQCNDAVVGSDSAEFRITSTAAGLIRDGDGTRTLAANNETSFFGASVGATSVSPELAGGGGVLAVSEDGSSLSAEGLYAALNAFGAKCAVGGSVAAG